MWDRNKRELSSSFFTINKSFESKRLVRNAKALIKTKAFKSLYY